MKNSTPHPVIIVLASAVFFLIAFIVLAQDPLQKIKSENTAVQYCTSVSEGKTSVMAADGKPITETVTLKIGSHLTSNGTLIWKDGSKTKLQKGDCVGIDATGAMYIAKANSESEKNSQGITTNK